MGCRGRQPLQSRALALMLDSRFCRGRRLDVPKKGISIVGDSASTSRKRELTLWGTAPRRPEKE